MDFTVPTNQRRKIKESKTLNKHLDFANELKWLKNMWVTVIPIVVGALGTVLKGLKKKKNNRRIWKSGRNETIQTIELLGSTGILRSFQETWGNLPLVGKNNKKWNNNNNNNNTKCYMPKLESVLENEKHKILRDFRLQINHLILIRTPDLVIV